MPHPVQFSLFGDSRQVMSSAGFVAGMKAAMRGIVDGSGKSREQIKDAMNEIVRATGKGLCKGTKFITLPTLEKWLASEERGQLPDLWGMHVLMLATGNNLKPLETWLMYFDCSVLDAVGRKKLELADLELGRKLLEKRRRKLKEELSEKL
jgi:hypothetical protein